MAFGFGFVYLAKIGRKDLKKVNIKKANVSIQNNLIQPSGPVENVLPIKPDDLSLISRIHIMAGEK